MIVEDSYTEIDKFGGFVLDVYKGSYKIVSAWKDEDGKVHFNWCYPQRGKTGEKSPRDKAVPWGINLGAEKEKAINVLRAIATAVKNASQEEKYIHDGSPDGTSGEPIPF